jgi:hypothetical protein
MDGVYGHVTDAMRARLVEELQDRWVRLSKNPSKNQ